MLRLPLPYTIPFAVLALLSGCSSSSDNAPGADASIDEGASSDAANDTTQKSDGAQGDDDDDANDNPPVDGNGVDQIAPPIDAGPVDAASGHVLAQFPPNDAGGSGWALAMPIAESPLVAISVALDSQTNGTGSDQWASTAHDGANIAFVTTRFHCQSGDCLAIADGDGANASLVEHTPGQEIVPDGRPAVASGGALIVYPSGGDLFAIKKSGTTWGAPVVITTGMTQANAHDVSLSYDDTTAVFDCGPSPYQDPGTDICTAKTDGSGESTLFTHTAGPNGGATNATHHPGYAPDGTVVFEADWGGTERIWRYTAPSTFALVASTQSNDNSPCVFPDGRIASLWLDGPNNPDSLHALKVMSSNGASYVMVTSGIDINDTGQSCGAK